MSDATSHYRALLRDCSIEVTAREPKTIDSCPEKLDPGTLVYLTWIPGDDLSRTVAAAATLRRTNLIPVPHIGARHIESAAQLDDLMARFHGEAAVDHVLVIGGDRDRPAGPYDSSLAVMESGLLQKHGITHASIGGFPEGNPKIPGPALETALVDKIARTKRDGLTAQIVTQFCFESAPIVDWLRHIRGRGIDVKVRLGLAGPAGIATLTRFALRCGVGNSIRALTRAPSLTKLLTESSPEAIIRELAAAAAAEPALGITGLHFFVFGGFNKTADWIRGARAAA